VTAFAGENLLRELAPQVLGAVIRRFGDFSASEDAVQDALIAAAQQWPSEGLPENPRGWLIQVAVRRMTDHLRAESARRRRERQADAGGAAGNGAVVSPMQGTVLKVAVTDGDAVHDGDLLLVVEAMKMENEIVAPREGIVSGLAVTVGAGVSSGQLLCLVAEPDGK